MHHIVFHPGLGFMTPRRATGQMYKSRTDWSRDIDDARVFNNLAAAKNSAKQALGEKAKWECSFLKITLVIEPIPDAEAIFPK